MNGFCEAKVIGGNFYHAAIGVDDDIVVGGSVFSYGFADGLLFQKQPAHIVFMLAI